MKQENVNICDVCNEKIAIEKCSRCKTDLCRSCAKVCQACFSTNNARTPILEIIMCKNCKDKTSKLLYNDEIGKKLIIKHINKCFIDITQKKEILNAIEEDKD